MPAKSIAFAVSAFLFSYTAWAGGASAPAPSRETSGGSGAALKAKHEELREALAKNAFGRPLHLDSKEGDDQVRGDLYAVIDHPFAKVAGALGKAPAWCEVLVMPMHVQQCSAGDGGIALTVASKLGPDAGEGTKLRFNFDAAAKSADFFSARLTAPEGPVGTRDYKTALDAVPLDAGHTFIHISYSYGYGSMAKLATQTYLSTSGKDKVGFTANGMRGILERNAMRYLLAVDAYLASLSAPPAQRIDKRLKAWHASLERYPKQLREPQPDYLALKREQMAALAK